MQQSPGRGKLLFLIKLNIDSLHDQQCGNDSFKRLFTQKFTQECLSIITPNINPLVGKWINNWYYSHAVGGFFDERKIQTTPSCECTINEWHRGERNRFPLTLETQKQKCMSKATIQDLGACRYRCSEVPWHTICMLSARELVYHSNWDWKPIRRRGQDI